MNEDVRALERPGVVVEGFVPDLAALLAEVRMTVAPLRFGAGLKGKVVSSLSHGVPCVMTPIAMEGSELIDGEHALVGRTEDQLAALVSKLYVDEALWLRLSDAGVRLCREEYSIEAVRRRLAGVLRELGPFLISVDDAVDPPGRSG